MTLTSRLLNSGILSLTLLLTGSLCLNANDSIAGGFLRPLSYHIGVDLTPALVPGTSSFLRGDNSFGKPINGSLGGSVRLGFKYSDSTREGMLYRGLYQGIGIGALSMFRSNLLGTPVSAYIYQGAPIIHFGTKLWLGYEWQFGAAFGWKHSPENFIETNAVVSTSVTAHMGLGLQLHYDLNESFSLWAGGLCNHYSNGNTSWPNAGVNTIGLNIGFSYLINKHKTKSAPINQQIIEEADRARWFYDVVAYGAWRRRGLTLDGTPMICPGKFAVIGFQFSPMRQLNRWVAVGPSIDVQWDESAGLAPYWVQGSYNEFLKFVRPPLGKQLSVGLSAHAELIMPIFSVNAALGYDFLNPEGNKAFYQSLALKTFITHKLYINVGYRLGSFKDPENLMLGLGIRL